MALEVDLVCAAVGVVAPEEVVEPHLVQRRGGGVGRDVPADAEAGPLRAVDHHGRVPADVGPDPALDVLVAGERWLGGGGDRVDVVGVAVSRGDHVALLGPVQDAQHELAGADATGVVDDRVHGVKPFLCLGWIGVGRLEINDASVSRLTLQLGAHGGVLLSTTRSCRVRHGSEWPDHAGAVRRFGAWHGLD